MATRWRHRAPIDEELAEHRKSPRVKPDYADAHFNSGVILYQRGKIREAIGQWGGMVSAVARQHAGPRPVGPGACRPAPTHRCETARRPSNWPNRRGVYARSRSDDSRRLGGRLRRVGPIFRGRANGRAGPRLGLPSEQYRFGRRLRTAEPVSDRFSVSRRPAVDRRWFQPPVAAIAKNWEHATAAYFAKVDRDMGYQPRTGRVTPGRGGACDAGSCRRWRFAASSCWRWPWSLARRSATTSSTSMTTIYVYENPHVATG